jgi:hypothetical protein
LRVSDHRLTKKLLASCDPSLEKAIDICRSEELAAGQSRRKIADSQHQLNKDSVWMKTDEEHVDMVKYGLCQQDGLRQKDRLPQLAHCSRCGRKHSSKKCPTWGKRAKRVMVLTILPQSVVARKSMSLTPLIQARDT